MERKMLVLLVGLTLTGITQIRAQDLVSKEEAIRIVKEEILKEDTLKVALYMTSEPLPKDSVITAQFPPPPHTYPTPYQKGWFFFIDDYPERRFIHPCRYAFLEDSRYYTIIQEQFYPDIWNSMDTIIPPPLGIKENSQSFLPSLQIYPSPGGVVISYDLPKEAFVSLEIWDTIGKLIKRLMRSMQNKGRHCIYWDGRDEKGRKVPNGIYFCKLRAGNTYRDIVKLVEIR